MISRTITLLCLFSLLLVHAAMGQSQSKTIVEQQVDSVFHTMVYDAKNLAYDKLSTGVDDRYRAGFIVNGNYFDTYDSLVNILKTRSQGVSRQSIIIHKEKVTALSSTIVLVTASGDTRIEVSNGNAFTVKFAWSFVYEKTGTNWKVIQLHQSSIK